MTITPDEAVGPIDFVILEFPADRLDGSAAAELANLVEAGTVRVLDLVLIAKGADGNAVALEATDPVFEAIFGELTGAQSGILDDDDIAEAAAALEPNTVAAVIVYENTWAAPFVAAARRNGGEVVASGRIPAADVIDALEALENN